MRFCIMSLAVAMLSAGSVSAQWLPVYGPFGRGGYPYFGPSYSIWGFQRGFASSRTLTRVVIVPPIIEAPRLELEAAERLNSVVRRLPQVPPPDELELLAKPALRPLPPLNLAGFLGQPKAGNKANEIERLENLGRDAFAAGEPGRAAERFQQAIAADPDCVQPRFLLAQAEFALGRFREAVVAIIEGMKRRPEWPAAAFDLRDLYGKRGAEFVADIDRLRRAIDRKPDDPALRFLLGYQLWFSGRRDEARNHFEWVLPRAEDPAPVKRFLDTPHDAR